MTAAQAAPREHVVRAALRAMRPRQWLKNLLVLAAPLTAGLLLDPAVLAVSAGAFVAFCAVASAVYLVNDTRDAEDDRRHPTKRFRPIAQGTLSERVAWLLAAVLLAGGLVLGFVVHVDLGVVLSLYVALQVAYSAGLKHQPVLDLAVVASGFLLRAIAGGAAAQIPLSQWFLLVASFGSLFMVSGKRYSEIHSVGAEARTRRSLDSYSETYLRYVWSIASAITIATYSLWAFEQDRATPLPWAAMSIAPFTLGLLRYAVDIDRGAAGAPEDIVLGDRVLQALGAAWLGLVVLNVVSR